MKKIILTGNAGFIGYHVAKRLIKNNYFVIGIDNINSYYDVNLKKQRLELLSKSSALNNNYKFYRNDLEDTVSIKKIFEEFKPDTVIHLAAQAGVRYSIKKPLTYINSNIVGFMNILESCRKFNIKNLIYASSSSVYGGNSKMPYSESNNVDHPVSVYAVTKKSNELMAHTYSHLYSLPTTGLRFFTVYGPWGRPDMSYFLFTKAILEDQSIDVFNYGEMMRDFTFVDDIIESILRVIYKVPVPDKNFDKNSPDISKSWAPYRIFNIGNEKSIKLIEFIEILEEIIGKESKKNFLPMPKGDVLNTLSDTKLLENHINFKPKTNIREGLEKFVIWYKNYHKIL